MVQAAKTFRVFVSSTFSDLIEERNALQRDVFPRLRALCQEHGCRFQAIDLRWGVREEAALDQQAMRICTEEIERCQHTELKPNFIVLLGDKYGWQPVQYEIRATLFEDVLERVSAEDRQLLEQWYLCDDNAVPPAYYLQPRTGAFIEYAVWEPVERQLRTVLESATEGMQLNEAERLDFFGSATEQEIYHGALNVPDAHEHVFCFFRTIDKLPHDERAHDFIDLSDGQLNRTASKRLYNLKEELRAYLPNNIFNYAATWQEHSHGQEHPVTTEHLAQLCEDVYNSLEATIVNEIERFEHIDEIDEEQANHWAFAEERAAHFEGREQALGQIVKYLDSEDRRPFFVRGVSGVGKSALLARAAQDACERFGAVYSPCPFVVCRFIGATPDSSDGRSLLESLCRQVSRLYGEDESSLPTDYNGLVKALPERLALATPERPLIIVLDALDQLAHNDNAHLLAWLPAEVPPNVCLVVSILPGNVLDTLTHRSTPPIISDLPPMSPDEGRIVLGNWLNEAGRTLQEHQRKEVLAKFNKNGLPLYLRLAFEEARRWRSSTPFKPLSPSLEGIIGSLFERLESPEQHGKLFVTHCLGYIAAARRGLTEDELLDVLSRDEEVFNDFTARAYHTPPEQRLPVVIWSRLFFDLEPYMTERSADGTSLLTFYHRQLAEAVQARFLDERVQDAQGAEVTVGVLRHWQLAAYFGGQPYFTAERVPSLRVASELPYQQTEGALWEELEGTLTDLRFIETKCEAGMTYDLVNDYAEALDALPEAQEERESEREREEAVVRYVEELVQTSSMPSSAHVARVPQSLLRKLLRFPTRRPLVEGDSKVSKHGGYRARQPCPLPSVVPLAEHEIQEKSERIVQSPTRLDRMHSFERFVSAETHNFAHYAPSYPQLCVQQAHNFADAGPVAAAASRRLAEGGEGGVLLMNRATLPQFRARPACVRVLEGHSSSVRAVSLSADGRVAVSGSWDKTVRVWDVETGECVRVLEGHSNLVDAVSLSADGRVAVSGSEDNTVRVWDVEHCTVLALVPLSARGRGIAFKHDQVICGASTRVAFFTFYLQSATPKHDKI